MKASANLYSLIECAKINGLEPYAYLRYVFTELPKAGSVEAIEALLPGGSGHGSDQDRLSKTGVNFPLTVQEGKEGLLMHQQLVRAKMRRSLSG